MAAILNYTDLLYNYYNNDYIALMLISTYGSNFTQITPPHNQNQGGGVNNLWISKGGHFVLAVKKFLKGAKVACRGPVPIII